MRHFTRIISGFLALLMLLVSFAGCSEGSETTDARENTENIGDNGNTGDDPQSKKNIMLSDLDGCKIVLPKYATSYIKMLADILKSDIKEATGKELSIIEKSEGGACEILLGDTGVFESTAFHKTLGIRDFGYKVEGKKILLAGPTAAMLGQSVNAFIADVVEKISGEVFAKESLSAVTYGTYDEVDHTIASLPLKGIFVLHSADATKQEITKVQDLVGKLSKLTERYVFLRSITDTDWNEENVLYFGKKTTVRDISAPEEMGENDVYINHSEKTIAYMYSDASHTMVHAETLFDEALKLAKDGAIKVAENKHYSANGPFSVMSFNVYYGNDSEQDYIERVITMIRNQMPDTLGLQEATQTWMNLISAALPEYAYVGISREPQKENDEYSAIFYRTDKFNLIDSGTKWLSETPDVPSKFPGAMLNRVMTYVLLESKEDGTRFLHVNTHLDHKEDRLRMLQMKVIRDLVKDLKQGEDLPIFFTGDFNSVPEGDPYRRFTKEYGFRDASHTAAFSYRVPTYHNYKDNVKKQSYLDYIFLNPNVEAAEYRVLDQKINDDYASDHHPIIATVWCYNVVE